LRDFGEFYSPNKTNFMVKSTSLSAEIYGDVSFARKYAQNIVDNAWNACYERPASLSLVPADLQDKSVLDAGCGPGITTAFFLQQGALLQALIIVKKWWQLPVNKRMERQHCCVTI
jgi:hypothetical protein